MYRFIYLVFILFVLQSFIHLGLCLNTALDDLSVEDYMDFDTDNISSSLLTTTTIIEPIDEEIINNVTEPITTTTISYEKQVKPFLIEVDFINISEYFNVLRRHTSYDKRTE
jgi:hypothetical protein